MIPTIEEPTQGTTTNTITTTQMPTAREAAIEGGKNMIHGTVTDQALTGDRRGLAFGVAAFVEQELRTGAGLAPARGQRKRCFRLERKCSRACISI